MWGRVGDGSTLCKRLLCLALPLRRPAGARPEGTAAGGASPASEGCCSGPGVQTAGRGRRAQVRAEPRGPRAVDQRSECPRSSPPTCGPPRSCAQTPPDAERRELMQEAQESGSAQMGPESPAGQRVLQCAAGQHFLVSAMPGPYHVASGAFPEALILP
ncbi:hypothetical protein MC885_006505 [Smutsia gigantea]|nr:hypothetical protein MC885_006505 [Smutsia gigantea]